MSLSPDQLGALEAILSGPKAWTREEDLAREHSQAVLKELQEAGWITRWSEDALKQPLPYCSWTLTAWGAYQLGCTIDEFKEIPRWTREPVSRPFHMERRRHMRSEKRLGLPELVKDPEIVLDFDDEPLTLCGVQVLIDHRLKPRRRQARRSRKSSPPPATG